MEGQREAAKGRPRAQPTVPIQQDFLFVDAAQAKTSRQGRRNARSFVMQKARREHPWSTSKHAAKQKKSSGSASPKSAGTPDSLLTPNTATPSPPIIINRTDYFPFVERNVYGSVKAELCPDCQIFLCRSGQRLCPRCLLLKPASPIEVPNSGLFDPFRSSSVEINGSVSELLEHCKSKTLHPHIHLETWFEITELADRQPWPPAVQVTFVTASSECHLGGTWLGVLPSCCYSSKGVGWLLTE